MQNLLSSLFFCLAFVSAQALSKPNAVVAEIVLDAFIRGTNGQLPIGNGGQVHQQGPATKQPNFPSGNAYAKSNIIAKLIPAEGNTWGYDIMVEGERFIHQPSKPGLPGNRGFATQAKAQKVAKLMIQKMKRGEMPPSISIEEMKKLKAI